MSAELQMLLIGVGILGFGALVGFLVRLINAKVKNAMLGGMLARLTEAVGAAVKATAQTYSDALKDANADGQLTKEEQQAAFAKAMAKAKSYVSLDELGKVFGLGSPQAAESFLADKVEAAVKDMNAGKS